ncbi:MAG: AtpZ/AtpI family protein [Ignavibacteriaceae bacterium]|jgi:F0F1-type ATP synthase assembly protein I|nr:AtpZ/AtpI family protein [Ignavibacteriaceae bacterium]
MGKKESSGFNKSIRDVAPLLGLGMQLAATIVITVLFGDWLDNKFQTGYLYTIIFAVLGTFAGLYHFIKSVLDAEKKKNSGEKE